MQLVNAQQARRILDRLVGYKISPLLWRNVRRGLSAGRVQSVALKIIVDREREIDKFVPVEYWSIEAELTRKTPSKTPAFRAMLVGLADGTKLEIRNEKDELEQAAYSVAKVKTKKATRRPAPPFITSTLQQEAWRKLRFTAKQTMAIAQQLYEGLAIGDEGSVGLITYMRTDSTRVARSAVAEARDFIVDRYGSQFIPPHARSFATKVKGAQEAHEAIRPTKVWREPSLIKSHLNKTQFKLYELIWKRMVASQMSVALFDNTTVEIEAKRPRARTKYLFRTSTSIVTFPGFMTIYTEGKDEGEEEGKKKSLLPHLEKGNELKLLDLFPEQHFTQPPPRFTEATLVKTLEQWGIGRPSTYAPTLSTIQDREYVTKTKGRFQPTELGCVVNDLLVKHFPDIINIKFTARMEDELDEIASENRDWVSVIQDFYTPFEKGLQNASEVMERVKLADELVDETCPKCDKPLAIKTGRFGKFLACSGYPDCKFTKPYQIKIGVKCPECGSEMIQRLSKKRRIFYTLYRGKQTKCAKCEYKGKIEESETPTSTK